MLINNKYLLNDLIDSLKVNIFHSYVEDETEIICFLAAILRNKVPFVEEFNYVIQSPGLPLPKYAIRDKYHNSRGSSLNRRRSNHKIRRIGGIVGLKG